MENGLRKEFPFGAVVRMSNAKAGHEEELVKLVTLLMYLGVVKHHNPSLANMMQDYKLFNQEVQLRFKCILQVIKRWWYKIRGALKISFNLAMSPCINILTYIAPSQALMEHHAVLTPSLPGEIMMSNVSETTGQLSAVR